MIDAVDNAILEESGAPDELVIPDPGEEVIMEIPDQTEQEEEEEEHLPVVRKVGKRGGADYIVPGMLYCIMYRYNKKNPMICMP